MDVQMMMAVDECAPQTRSLEQFPLRLHLAPHQFARAAGQPDAPAGTVRGVSPRPRRTRDGLGVAQVQMQADLKWRVITSKLNAFGRSALAHHQAHAGQRALAVCAHDGGVDGRAAAEIVCGKKDFFLQDGPI
jgi:hypothetical protein